MSVKTELLSFLNSVSIPHDNILRQECVSFSISKSIRLTGILMSKTTAFSTQQKLSDYYSKLQMDLNSHRGLNRASLKSLRTNLAFIVYDYLEILFGKYYSPQYYGNYNRCLISLFKSSDRNNYDLTIFMRMRAKDCD